MSTTAEASAQRVYPPNIIANSSLTSVKFLSACFAGATAGILGVENWLGFALFLSSTLFTSACIYAINCHGKPSKYFQGGVTELVNPGQDNAFTFVLVWTLFYGLSVYPRPRQYANYRTYTGIVHGEFRHLISCIHSLLVAEAVSSAEERAWLIHMQFTIEFFWDTILENIPFECHIYYYGEPW